MIPDPRTTTYSGEPEIENAWLAQACQYASQMQNHRQSYGPEAFEDEKAFRCHDTVQNEKAVGYACQHLRAGERQEDRLSMELIRHFLTAERS